MGYQDFNSKPLTDGASIAKGSVSLEHLDAALFEAVQQIKLHKHTGIDSQQLDTIATPNVLKALGPQNREEHGLASGSGNITFGTPFISAPFVLVSPTSVTMPYVTSVSKTGFTINAAGGYWIAIGR